MYGGRQRSAAVIIAMLVCCLFKFSVMSAGLACTLPLWDPMPCISCCKGSLASGCFHLRDVPPGEPFEIFFFASPGRSSWSACLKSEQLFSPETDGLHERKVILAEVRGPLQVFLSMPQLHVPPTCPHGSAFLSSFAPHPSGGGGRQPNSFSSLQLKTGAYCTMERPLRGPQCRQLAPPSVPLLCPPPGHQDSP